MKRTLRTLIVLLLVLSCPLFAEEAGLLFKVDFDGYSTTANYAKGKAESLNFKGDLQLRMYPGVDGKGNGLQMAPKEFVEYEMKDNFNLATGTVNFWLCADDWKFSDKMYQVFFEARCQDYRIILYKYAENPLLTFYFEVGGKQHFAMAKPVDKDWLGRRWHMLTATWDKDGMKLYVDGKLPPDYAPGNTQAAFPKHSFKETLKFGQDVNRGSINLGNLNGGWKPTATTGIDELRIYDIPLSQQRIQKLYEALRPPEADKAMDGVMGIPQYQTCNVNIDGKFDDADWSKAVRMPLIKAYRGENHECPTQSNLRLMADDKNLYLAFYTDFDSTRHTFTKNDDTTYKDDCFETYMRNGNGKEMWFDINSNGAIFDALDQDASWNSGAVAKGKRLEKGWQLEVAIPLEGIGIAKVGDKLKATFFGLNFKNAPNYYCVWHGDPGSKDVGGYIVLVKPEDAVSIEDFGSIYGGKMQLNLKYQGNRPQVLLDGKEASFECPMELGRHKLQIKRGSSFAYELQFFVEQPMALSYKSFPAQKKVEVRVDLGNAGDKFLAGLNTAKGRVTLMRDGKEISAIEFAPQMLNFVNLPLPKLESGLYSISSTVRSQGQELSRSTDFRVPDFTPYLKPVADDHIVPEPWLPVKPGKGGRFDILDRTYVFDESPFPAKLFSRNQSVLAKRQNLLLNGQDFTWFGRKVVEKYEDYVVMKGSGKSGDFRVEWRGELWFDGLWKLDFSIDGRKGAKIDRLGLDWTVDQGSSRYFLSLLDGDYVTIPWKDGKITNNLNICEGNWLTGIETGIMWMALDNANWRLAGPAVEMSKAEKGVDVKMNLISQPADFPGKLNYSIAFMATPGKPAPKGHRMFNVGSYNENKHENIQIASTGGIARGDGVYAYASHIMRDPETFRKQYIEPYAAKNVALYPYHQPKGISLFDAEWDYFVEEWRTTPGYAQTELQQDGVKFDFVHCCGKGIADLMAYRFDKLLNDYPQLGGVYYDISQTMECSNKAHGHGGVDAFGKEYRTSNAMWLRHYFMRIYKVAHRHGKKLFIHSHNRFVPIVHNFADIWYPGENETWKYGKNPDYYYCEVPVEEYQAAWSSVIRGAAIVRGTQVSRVATFIPSCKLIAQKLNTEAHADRSFASAWIYDFNSDSDWIDNTATEKFWCDREKANLGEAIFHGYWFDDAVKSRTPGMLVSWYELKNVPWSKLIVVGNFTRQAAPVALTGKLLNGVTELEDLRTGKVYSLAEANKLMIPDNLYRLFLVK